MIAISMQSAVPKRMAEGTLALPAEKQEILVFSAYWLTRHNHLSGSRHKAV